MPKSDKKSKAPSKLDKKSSSAKLIPPTTSAKKGNVKTTAKIITKNHLESDSSDSEEALPVTNGKSKDLHSDESSEDSSSEDEKPKALQVKASSAKAVHRSRSSDSDAPAPTKVKPSKAALPTAGTKKKADLKRKADSSSDSEDSEDSEDDDEPTSKKVAPKVVPPATKSAPSKSTLSSKSDSDSSSDSDDESVPKKRPSTLPSASKGISSKSSEDSDSSSDDDEAPKPALNKGTASSSSESSDEDGDAEMQDVPVANAGKRKPVDKDTAPKKKIKLSDDDAAPGDAQSMSIFVGRLSWSVDNDRLAQEFSGCGEVVSATVQMDRNTGKSRGFGYVHFATTEAVEKALQMNGQEIDGRPVNIDRSQALDKTQVREKRANAFGDETSSPSTTLFIGNLSFSVTEDTVWSFFNEWGVKSVRLPTDRDTGRAKGFGYVEFEDLDGAKKAFEGAAGAEIEGRNIRVDYSQPRDSSGGGGRGGRGGGRGGFGGDRGGRGGFGGGRGGFGGGRGGFGGERGGRGGRGGGRGGRGGDRGGRGGFRGGARTGGITAFEGKKTTF